MKYVIFINLKVKTTKTWKIFLVITAIFKNIKYDKIKAICIIQVLMKLEEKQVLNITIKNWSNGFCKKHNYSSTSSITIKKKDSSTHTTQIGINACASPQSSEHCP